MRRCVDGPRVFPSQPDDPRPIVVFAVGGKILQARFPLITSRPWSDRPILPEIKVMAGRYTPGRELPRDPYHTLPLEAA